MCTVYLVSACYMLFPFDLPNNISSRKQILKQCFAMAQSVTSPCHPLGPVHMAFCCVTTQLAHTRLLTLAALCVIIWRIWIIVAAVESRRLQIQILPSHLSSSSTSVCLPPLPPTITCVLSRESLSLLNQFLAVMRGLGQQVAKLVPMAAVDSFGDPMVCTQSG